MNRACTLVKRIRVKGGTRFVPVVWTANGRLKADYVTVGGKEQRHPEGSYYITWYVGKKCHRESAGKDPIAAVAARLRKAAVLADKAAGNEVVEPVKTNGGTSVADAIALFLDEVRNTKKRTTYRCYKSALDYFQQYFQQNGKKQYLAGIDREDLVAFHGWLRGLQTLSPRTISNKFKRTTTFLRKAGHPVTLAKEDRPRFVEEEPEIYEREDLDRFFAACGGDGERLWFEYFLMTGCREQEVQHATWDDINFARGVVAVRYKAQYGFSPKAYKPREIPIPSKLVMALKAWKTKANPLCPLLFPTAGCRPKLNFLRCCKDVAERAGLNPADWWLHKFRATFATWHLWNGVDLRTVQDWMGHSDLESTLRYLKPNRGEAVREKVEALFS